MLTTIFETNNNITLATHFMPDALLTDIFATIVGLKNDFVSPYSFFFIYIYILIYSCRIQVNLDKIIASHYSTIHIKYLKYFVNK